MIPSTAIQTSPSQSYRQSFLASNLDHYDKQDVVNFLKSSHTVYEKVTIPEIEQNFLGLMKLLPNEPSLSVIFHLFVTFQISLELHMEIEERTMYPSALENKTMVTGKLAEDCAHEEPFLTEIIDYLNKQTYSENPFCRTLIHRLERFNEELKHHAWIEDHLL